MSRRKLLKQSAAGLAATGVLGRTNIVQAKDCSKPLTSKISEAINKRCYKLGLVTYNLARDWDQQTIIDRCKAAGISAVEFRSTHKHGVEPILSKTQRSEVKKRFNEAGLVIWGLGTACGFHYPDAKRVAENIEVAKRFIDLARDIGAKGVKVRPNGLPKEVSEDKTLEQIGRSLRICGQTGADAGVEIWCEVHGSGTCHPPRMRRIMDIADHPNVGICWNSNNADIKEGSVREYFELLRDSIRSVHFKNLIGDYPYREFFSLLRSIGYDRYTLIEDSGLQSASRDDTIRFLRYYKALWEELSRSCGNVH
ncbi:MAG: sugar phosphate isomerase/epimerase family protein [Planctomycetota bacterium]|jgi:sugar phosphate isomerase/epimerase